jgi:hypothetical protein
MEVRTGLGGWSGGNLGGNPGVGEGTYRVVPRENCRCSAGVVQGYWRGIEGVRMYLDTTYGTHIETYFCACMRLRVLVDTRACACCVLVCECVRVFACVCVCARSCLRACVVACVSASACVRACVRAPHHCGHTRGSSVDRRFL